MSLRDLSHLVKWQKEIKSKNNIHFGKTNDVRSSHSSDFLCNDLIRLGCTPRKSLTLKFPKLSNKLIRHFIRGYFDGDGTACIHKNRLFIGILGNKPFISEMNKKLNIKCFCYPKSGIYYLQIASNTACEEFYHYIYDYATVFLERKKDIFKKWLKIPKPGPGNYEHIKQRTRVAQKNKITKKIIKIWNSISEASSTLDISRDGIGSVLAKRQKTSGGYIWERM